MIVTPLISRTTRLRLTAMSLSVVASFAAGAQTFEAPDTDFQGRVTPSSQYILPGNEIQLNGSNFKPGQVVTLLRGDTALGGGPLNVGADGTFSVAVQIPTDAVPGRHPVVVNVANPSAAEVIQLKVSEDIPLSGADAFDVTPAPLTAGLYQVAYSAASDALYVTSAIGRPPVTTSALLKVDPDTLEIVARVTPAQVGGYDDNRVYAVYGVGVDDANGNVWVTNTRDNTVAVYRQSDLTLVKQFERGLVPHARDVVVDPGTGRVYSNSAAGNTVTVFDGASLEHIETIEIQSAIRGQSFVPMSLTIDEVQGKLYSPSLRTPEVVVIDTASNTVDKIIPVPGLVSGTGAAWDAGSGRVLVTAQGSDNLIIIDPAQGTIEHDLRVGAGALNVVVEPASGLAFISNRTSGTVAVVDRDGQIVANLSGGTLPNHLTVDGKGRVFAVNKARGQEDSEGDRISRIVPTR